jgi:hypothetical protein
VRDAVEALFQPEPSPWLVRRLTKALDGLTQGDVRAALSRARIALDFPTAEPPPAELSDAQDPRATRARRRTSAGRPAPTSFNVTLKDLIDAGLIRPGARLRKRYLGQELSATVEPDGRVRFERDVYNSLSIAAGAARVAVKGPPEDGRRYYQTNGWTFWELEGENGQLQPMEALRKQYLTGPRTPHDEAP